MGKAIISIAPQILFDLLKFEGLEFRGANFRIETETFDLLVSHKSIPETLPGKVFPTADVEYSKNQYGEIKISKFKVLDKNINIKD